MTICQPGSWPLLDTESAGALIVDFSASRTVANEFLFFINSPSLWCFSYSSLNRLRHPLYEINLHPWGNLHCSSDSKVSCSYLTYWRRSNVETTFSHFTLQPWAESEGWRQQEGLVLALAHHHMRKPRLSRADFTTFTAGQRLSHFPLWETQWSRNLSCSAEWQRPKWNLVSRCSDFFHLSNQQCKSITGYSLHTHS